MIRRCPPWTLGQGSQGRDSDGKVPGVTRFTASSVHWAERMTAISSSRCFGAGAEHVIPDRFGLDARRWYWPWRSFAQTSLVAGFSFHCRNGIAPIYLARRTRKAFFPA